MRWCVAEIDRLNDGLVKTEAAWMANMEAACANLKALTASESDNARLREALTHVSMCRGSVREAVALAVQALKGASESGAGERPWAKCDRCGKDMPEKVWVENHGTCAGCWLKDIATQCASESGAGGGVKT